MKYRLIQFDQLKEGDPVMAFGVHVLRWKFAEWGNPSYAFTDADSDNRKSKEELLEALAKVEADERLHYPAVTIYENAPLAMEQIVLETKQRVLRWMLGDDAPLKPDKPE